MEEFDWSSGSEVREIKAASGSKVGSTSSSEVGEVDWASGS